MNFTANALWIISEIGKEVYNKTGKYLLSMDGDGNDLIYMMLQAEGESQFKDGCRWR